MAHRIMLRGRKIDLDPRLIRGQGGEADIFDIRSFFPGEPALALKVWKGPDHPDYEGNSDEAKRNRLAAKARLREYGKKLPAFPSGLPPNVIAPRDLATEIAGTDPVGFTMSFLDGTHPLREYSARSFRESSGIEIPQIVQIFRALHSTVNSVHARRVVIGDFNHLNVLVRGLDPFIIDADSMQFGPFQCRTFTPRFVDPRICDPTAKHPVQTAPHSSDTDWYAFACMLFEAVMLVHPYGGIFTPKHARDRLIPDERPLKRVSVFDPRVSYSKHAVPLTWLPRPVREYYSAIFNPKTDQRGMFPAELLTVLEVHARGQYIDPATIPAAIAKKEVIRTGASSRRCYQIHSGKILEVGTHEGALLVLSHQNGEFVRETGEAIFAGNLSPDFRYRICGAQTLVGTGNRLIVFSPGKAPQHIAVDQYRGGAPEFESNGRHYYWTHNGYLYREDEWAPKNLGSVLEHQTRFWVGPTFGCGFYRAGSLTTGFVFDAERGGLNDSVKLPALRGELVDAACYFSSARAWLFTATRERGVITNRCVTISSHGEVMAIAEAKDGDDSWLGSIHNRCAATVSGSTASGSPSIHRLFVATEAGLVGVDESGGALVETVRYSQTKDLVDSDTEVLRSRAGEFLLVSNREVRKLVLG